MRSVSNPRRPILVTGGAGFIGSNLADCLASEGHSVVVLDSLTRPGADRNLAWLKQRHPRRVSALVADLRDEEVVREAASKASAVFHFAAQVAVTTSLEEPREDFDINVGGTLNLLETLRQRDEPVPLVFASTNKVYGDLGDVALIADRERYRPRDPAIAQTGIDEQRCLDFHTPYGCSKGAADQYVLDYARSFGLRSCVLRMSCIYGRRQMGTEDQGWVAHFLIRALTGQPIKVFGDGRQVRDVLDVRDAIAAYLAAWRRIEDVRGCAFNLGGGPENAVSLREVLAHAEQLLGRPIACLHGDWRRGDQRWYVSDARRARTRLDLPAPIPWKKGVAELLDWLTTARNLRREAPAATIAAVEARP